MMKINLTLPGTIRSKKNSKRIVPIPAKKKSSFKHLFKFGGWKPAHIVIHPSTAYLKWEKAARQSLIEQGWIGPATDQPVCVKAVYFYKGKRPDLSGCHESIGDALEGEGLLWENDAQIVRWHGDSCLVHDLKNPRTEIEVEILKTKGD